MKLLAPTGKARVQLEQSTKIPTQTIAQFLIKLGGYDYRTGRYLLSDKAKVEVGKTLIIDEASMLTEEQLAAVLHIVKGVERLILVGDHRQLPPIGSGRPFVDIVDRLSPEGAGGRLRVRGTHHTAPASGYNRTWSRGTAACPPLQTT